MRPDMWYPLIVAGSLAIPVAVPAQSPHPTARRIATLPGVALDEAARLPNTVPAMPYEGRLELSPDGRTLVLTTEGSPTTAIYEIDLGPIVRALLRPE